MSLIYQISILTCLIFSIILLAGLVYASIIFYQEKENRAAFRALLLALLLPPIYFLSWFYNWEIVALILSADLVLMGILFFISFGKKAQITDDIPKHQIDERDIMFARNELKVNTDRYKEYYSKNPDKLDLDNGFRKEPGLTAEKSIFYNEVAYKAGNSSFFAVEQFKNSVDGPVHHSKSDISSSELSKFLKDWSKKLGALDVGITKLENYHFYSHKGRGEEYGNPIESVHSHAIAFTVEMSQEMVAAAPQSSIVMESAQQYLEAGRIAVQLAQFLRSMGFSARAHIDGNYQLVCPLVARDAGLGEIGRMGLLMTPKEGPRVRLGVVSTDFKLRTDTRIKDNSMLDFCLQCKKCAEVCPSKSISFDDPKLVNGIKRWQINSESCFTYWCKAGTDCGRCMACCPYSHPDNLLHNFIRFGIKKSSLFRMLAVHLDDFFYGRKPKSAELPSWIPNHEKAQK
ncbi:4Fe-4S dicluster domain-containing protein [Marinifilum caeruleilacunae]|uniref:4Fe-4S dicluster domain-containing protein n=1 Tax=Marinifilum caeruleilacunae TaxID=2499076 RepID=A0ABX1WUZ3_9BACT|nr:reductive dehalogenase domain-containing protein [Marinifilum caeruleilacunae]NOU59776.1 4Fe-4S dicluster domain-containing protein [Marinifilum caeruleilacunae]